MNVKKLVPIVLLILGGILIYFGLNAADSPLEKLSESVTGSYSDKTMYYIIGGSLSALVGLVLLLKK